MTQEQKWSLSCRNPSLLTHTPACERPEGGWLDPEHLTQPGAEQASVQTCGMKESWGPCRRQTPFPFLDRHLPTTFRPGLCIQWAPSEMFCSGLALTGGCSCHPFVLSASNLSTNCDDGICDVANTSQRIRSSHFFTYQPLIFSYITSPQG